MRTLALIRRIMLQLLRDKRTMALLFFAPLIVLTLMYFFFNGESEDPRLAVVGGSEPLMTAMENASIDVISYDEADNQTIISDNLAGLLEIKDGSFQVVLENNDPSTSRGLLMKITQIAAMQGGGNAPSIETKYIFGDEDTAFFDVLGPILVGFFVFFFVFLISGIGLLKERVSGTLERLLATPIRRWEIVVAYLTGFGIFAIIQTIIVVFYSIQVLDMIMIGQVWHVILVNLMLALVALSLGILLSTFASSEFQMVQFIPIVVIPQIFFAGIIPLEGMADWLQNLSRIMPLYYAADALKAIMYRGEGLADISSNLLALAAFAIVFIFMNIFALKRYRKL
ncbi:ABC transporter, permease protein [Planococcus donghaensis MPA1U2]|uniref:ABC transporter, permease protein n=1 Tax=Planococcus donghaensis MPA1U2 TaxID=933115 RepID=E7RKQ9_9BACL|nr:ABC transporter permease [Planococcus donghaensis]EGA88489.1 ABC transporter, permease protein [Planococcus donghaensis MPA1U2]